MLTNNGNHSDMERDASKNKIMYQGMLMRYLKPHFKEHPENYRLSLDSAGIQLGFRESRVQMIADDVCKKFMIEGMEYTFQFRQIARRGKGKYFISVVNNGIIRLFFEMEEAKKGEWIILQPAPEWIIAFKEKLSELLLSFINFEVR